MSFSSLHSAGVGLVLWRVQVQRQIAINARSSAPLIRMAAATGRRQAATPLSIAENQPESSSIKSVSGLTFTNFAVRFSIAGQSVTVERTELARIAMLSQV